MLFDATHPEETRVAVVRGNRVEEFDFEAENRKQLKGNIYLAKVTRVEPSLQAAFVDYGGNRHGFLAFSEIHPDYYQIPVADRQALLEEEAAAIKEVDNHDEEEIKPKRGRRKRSTKAEDATEESIQSDIVESLKDDEKDNSPEIIAEESIASQADNTENTEENDTTKTTLSNIEQEIPADEDDAGDEEDDVESVGSEDAMEEVPERSSRPRIKQYKIQEVIKRRQIILVQVVKEERGNKGAALTTYLSLAGRYSVLMPNTDRGGGISRKITNQVDRKKLRTIANDLDVPEGMGVILRTAGAARTKTEIKRDFEYLMRLWENVRELTLKSSAPALVYEEGSLLKRSIRDLYNKDINQVLVAGERGYREAKDFMRMLMPSHAKNVQPYKEIKPIFARFNVEAQLDAMFTPQVTLKSGGYLVINQTEALVAIDVNSGRSTRESSIEDTAFNTNLEAAEEVARQLRLRDLAGLVVIDFIDMEEKRNNRAVERRLKECLRLDRARIQVGRISPFGLLEMSRQRIRASVLESTMETCEHCQGTGYIRTPSSIALYVLRAIEEYLNKGSKYDLIIRTKSAVALYILNYKRTHLIELEARFGLSIRIEADETISNEYCSISRGERAEAAKAPTMVTPETIDIEAELARDAELDAMAEEEEQSRIAEDEQNNEQPRKRRRRKRRGQPDNQNNETSETQQNDEATIDNADSSEEEEGAKRKRRRRGRRGGRKERDRNQELEITAKDEADDLKNTEPQSDAPFEKIAEEVQAASETNETSESLILEDEKPSKDQQTITKISETNDSSQLPPEEITEPPVSSPPPHQNTKAAEDTEKAETLEKEEVSETSEEEVKPSKKTTKMGWWQRRSFF